MSTEVPVVSVSKKALWAGRVISALPVLLLLLSASAKLSGSPQVVEAFAQLGYTSDLIMPLGIVEIACAVVYVIPQTAVLGAILVTGYLGGATATHVRLHQPQFFMPVAAGILAWLGLFIREPRLRALIPFRRR